MTVTIQRTSQDFTGTHGSMYEGIKFLCYTEELPWLGNQPDISCIPEGTYYCSRHNSPSHPNTWQVNDVPGRSNVLIHTGNTVKDTEGCILVGMIKSPSGVLESVAALALLNSILPDSFTLIIQH